MEPQSRINTKIDLGLFLVVLVGARGFQGFLPSYSGRQHMIVALLLLALLVLRHLNQALSALLSRPLIPFFAGWMVVVSSLAVRPAESLAATMMFILLILYALARESSIGTTLETFALATSVSIAPSVVGLVFPVAGVSAFWGAGTSRGYAGYFPWNSLAGYCAGGALVCLAILYLHGFRKFWYLPAAASALVIVYFADTAAASVSLAAAGCTFLGITAFRRIGPWIVPLLAVGLVMVLSAIYNSSDLPITYRFTESIGRSDDFSGRTAIWGYGLSMLAESPVFGYGSGAVWDSERGPGSAHNGYIEFALKWGLPAALVLVAAILWAGYRLAKSSNPLLPLWTFGVVGNFAGSQLAALGITSLAIWLAVGSAAKPAARGRRGQLYPNTPSRSKSTAIASASATPRNGFRQLDEPHH